ncbi:MAG TPA: hypothetical protein DCM68_04385 [Verrucomicrobia bacterium]|nr:hypothetical protein [Verrucomicrobiota bacterium]
MKKRTLLILAAAVAMPLAALAADATLYADVLSAYVFRGLVGNDEAVFQPGLNVSGPLGLGYSLWTSMNLTDNEAAWYPDTAGEWGELNLGLNWTLPWEGPVSLTLGGTYFVYPQDASQVDEDGNASKAPADGSYEVYAKAAADGFLLSPSIQFCHDLDNTDDWIVLLGIAQSFDLMDQLSLALGASLGVAGDYYVADNYGSDSGAALTHAQFDAGLNYALNEQASIGLKGSFSSILDGDVRDDIEAEGFYPEVDLFYGGITAGYSF